MLLAMTQMDGMTYHVIRNTIKLETKYKIEKKHIAQAYPEITWRDGFTL